MKHLISGLMADWRLAFLKIGRCLPSLFCKSKMNIPYMRKALGKDAITSEKCCSISLWQSVVAPQKAAWQKAFHVFSTSRKPSANALFLLRLHAAVAVGCELHARQPLVLAVVSLPAFRCRCLYACTRPNLFCLIFGAKFNIFSVLFVRQAFTLPQKNDSREGLFWCKKGWHVDVGKMNFYLRKPPFAPYFGPFLAEYGAICCKMGCNMRQNAVRFGAKWRAFWC